MLDFRDQILVLVTFGSCAGALSHFQFQASPRDIEDLANAGRIAETCPYFGSRRAIPQAEVYILFFFPQGLLYTTNFRNE